MITNDPIFDVLARAIDVAALKQSVYSANIANASVPGYQRMDVLFDDALASASDAQALGAQPAARGDPALPQVSPQVVSTDEVVRLDHEMGLMAKNAVRYQALLGAFERLTDNLQMAIHEGKGA